MELVIKIAAVGVIVAVLQQILSRSGRDDYAMIMVLAGIVTAVAMLLREVSDVFDSVSSFLSSSCSFNHFAYNKPSSLVSIPPYLVSSGFMAI